MDYQAEQKEELETLESIYYGDVEILSTDPYHKFIIPVKTEDFKTEEENGLACNLVFTYTAKYPDELPIIEIEEPVGFDEEFSKELLKHLETEAQQSLGMIMIFTLVSSAIEWLNDKYKYIKIETESRLAKKLLEEEEAERKRFEGTRVTVETFLKWKTAFEDELGITKIKELAEKEGKKLTGRELFMKDKTLNESDLKFLVDGDEVKIDESLFTDVDDLEIYDDDEDDEDFDPDNYDSDMS